MDDTTILTAFAGYRQIASGKLHETVEAVKTFLGSGSHDPVVIFDEATGNQVDFDFSGSLAETLERLKRHPLYKDQAASRAAGPGRPRLGVVAREVTLLPRHWEWLSQQPGGASGALRKLVETARKSGEAQSRAAWEGLARIMWSVGGDLPRFEEASRALYARDADRLLEQTQDWPEDVRAFVQSRVADCRSLSQQESQ